MWFDDLIDRLTVTGWVVFIIHAGVACVLGPLLLFYVWPEILEVGGKITTGAIILTIMALSAGSFKCCQWLLESCGIMLAQPKDYMGEDPRPNGSAGDSERVPGSWADKWNADPFEKRIKADKD